MKFTRKAKAEWKGSGKEGQGHLTTGSKVLIRHNIRFIPDLKMVRREPILKN